MAPVPGRVVAVEVVAGDEVEPGATLVVLEAMKVEHRIVAATAAVVAEVLVTPGDNVDAHQLLVRLDSPAADDARLPDPEALTPGSPSAHSVDADRGCAPGPEVAS